MPRSRLTLRTCFGPTKPIAPSSRHVRNSGNLRTRSLSPSALDDAAARSPRAGRRGRVVLGEMAHGPGQPQAQDPRSLAPGASAYAVAGFALGPLLQW